MLHLSLVRFLRDTFALTCPLCSPTLILVTRWHQYSIQAADKCMCTRNCRGQQSVLKVTHVVLLVAVLGVVFGGICVLGLVVAVLGRPRSWLVILLALLGVFAIVILLQLLLVIFVGGVAWTRAVVALITVIAVVVRGLVICIVLLLIGLLVFHSSLVIAALIAVSLLLLIIVTADRVIIPRVVCLTSSLVTTLLLLIALALVATVNRNLSNLLIIIVICFCAILRTWLRAAASNPYTGIQPIAIASLKLCSVCIRPPGSLAGPAGHGN